VALVDDADVITPIREEEEEELSPLKGVVGAETDVVGVGEGAAEDTPIRR